MRRVWLSFATFAVAAALTVACLPHPSGDYDEFIEDTNSLRGEPPLPDGGGTVIDASVPIEATEGQYLAACLPSLSGQRADKALRFIAETKYVPGENGANGTLGLTLYPLAVTATVFDKANTVGEPLVVGDALPVDAQAKFSGTVARAQINKDANTISPRDIVIENTSLEGQFAAEGNFCSTFNTTVTAPITQSIVAKCTYIPMETGATYEIIVPSGTNTKSAIVANGVEYTYDKFGCAN